MAMAFRVLVMAILVGFVPLAQAKDGENDDPACSAPSPSPVFIKKMTPTPENSHNDWFWPHRLDQVLAKHCPPWYDKTWKTFQRPCKRDSANLAVRFIRPNNRCGPNGECMNAACVIFNSYASDSYKSLDERTNGNAFYPENSSAGFCIPAGKVIFGIPYIEHTIVAIPKNAWDWILSARWAQQDSPEVLTCESFCTGGPAPNKDTRWSGEHGYCKCHCVSGSSASQFDRCTSVSEKVCTDAQYCGGHGKATWKRSKDAKCSDEGQCSCECEGGWSGRNCELAPNTPCDINDCRAYGAASGTRPNCKCDCTHFYKGEKCTDWTWAGGKLKGTEPLKSSSFKNRNDACLDTKRSCPKWAGKGLCSRFPAKGNCAKSCNDKPSCKWMKGRWWVGPEQKPGKGTPSLPPKSPSPKPPSASRRRRRRRRNGSSKTRRRRRNIKRLSMLEASSEQPLNPSATEPDA